MLTSVGVPVVSETERLDMGEGRPTIVCFSHLRWDFVFQRPQHLMSRFAQSAGILFWEEPIIVGKTETPFVKVRDAKDSKGVRIATPHLPDGLSEEKREAALRRLLDTHLTIYERPLIGFYYTPMMLPFSRHIDWAATVYDCMDELSQFRFAPERLLDLEAELLSRADVVFTGGTSLFDAKKGRHDNVHCFPSSVDRDHFMAARSPLKQPDDQSGLPSPRLGYYGVIDERFDVDLLRQLADLRPDWTFVMVGPVVKVAPEDLPRAANIVYLGGKDYADLPAYLSGWDVALMPFAMNESTQFISPTKTPEYLAGGRPVVSTPVRDVVRHYGHLKGVCIAADADGFARACDQAMAMKHGNDDDWLAEADLLLSSTSWDITQARMAGLIAEVLGQRASDATLVAAE